MVSGAKRKAKVIEVRHTEHNEKIHCMHCNHHIATRHVHRGKKIVKPLYNTVIVKATVETQRSGYMRRTVTVCMKLTLRCGNPVCKKQTTVKSQIEDENFWDE